MEWLAGWYNWVFLFPLALAAIFILLEVLLGGITHVTGQVDADAHFEADADHDVDADGGHWAGLTYLGVGKVPLSIIGEMLLMSFGIIGLLINAAWSLILPSWPGASFFVALPIALIGSLMLTAKTTKRLAKLLPTDATISRESGGFLGEEGVVIVTVTPTSGQIRVDGIGSRPNVTLNCKALTSAAGIPRGSRVTVVDYLEASNVYVVAPVEEM